MTQAILLTQEELQQLLQDVAERTAEKIVSGLGAKKSDELPEYMTAKEVCKYRRISDRTLYTWRKAGYLTPICNGGKRVYRRHDIDLLAKKQSYEDNIEI